MLNVIVPVWVCLFHVLNWDNTNMLKSTETAPHTSRGMFVSIEFFLNIFGVVIAYWLGL